MIIRRFPVCDSQMIGPECQDCMESIGEGQANGRWMTTGSALTKDLSEDLRAAW